MPSTKPSFIVQSAPLGAGAKAPVNRVLNSRGGRRIALIVNDMFEMDIDANLVRRGPSVSNFSFQPEGQPL